MLINAFLRHSSTIALIWILNSRKLNSNIKRLEERFLFVISTNNLNTFDELLGLFNLFKFLIEIYCVLLLNYVRFTIPLNTYSIYGIKKNQTFFTGTEGTEWLSNLILKIWNSFQKKQEDDRILVNFHRFGKLDLSIECVSGIFVAFI